MVEEKMIPSSKGSVAVSIHYPKKATERLAILCPGFLDSKDYKHLVGLATDLCERGYTVVRVQPTGTWESEGNLSDYTTTQYLDDVRHVLDHMLGHGNFTYILIGGHSRGGKVSLLYAARDSRISAVLGIMQSSRQSNRWDAQNEEWRKAGFHTSLREMPNTNGTEKKEFRVPYSHVEDNHRYAVLDSIKNIKAPVFLFAGEKDETVPPADVQKIYEEANEPKKFVVIPGIGHDYRRSDSEVRIVNDIILRELNARIETES